MSAVERHAEPTPPPVLAEVQSFLALMFRRATAVTADASLSSEAARHVTGNDRLSPAEQVDIYRRQFWLRHEDALAEDYPALRFVLGEDLWDELVRDYLTRIVPRDFNLRDLGVRVPEFLESWERLPSDRRTVVLEAARYELAFIDVFDGKAAPPLDEAKLTALSPEAWEHARLELSPLVRRMKLEHPVHHLRRAIGSDEPPAGIPEPAVSRIVLFRRENVVHFEELVEDAWVMLEALAGGATLLAACAKIAEGKDEAAVLALSKDLGEWFRRWASWGVIGAVVLETSDASPA
ncbi:MAG: DNA-binding domain-containing protein [Polyangiaceae bacterium]